MAGRVRWLSVWGLGVVAAAAVAQSSVAADPAWLVGGVAATGLALLLAFKRI